MSEKPSKIEKIIYEDGSRYIGELKEGVPHGKGTLIWPDGKNYRGDFKNGYMNGWGVFIWPDLGSYEGEWKDGLQHGEGKRILSIYFLSWHAGRDRLENHGDRVCYLGS